MDMSDDEEEKPAVRPMPASLLGAIRSKNKTSAPSTEHVRSAAPKAGGSTVPKSRAPSAKPPVPSFLSDIAAGGSKLRKPSAAIKKPKPVSNKKRNFLSDISAGKTRLRKAPTAVSKKPKPSSGGAGSGLAASSNVAGMLKQVRKHVAGSDSDEDMSDGDWDRRRRRRR
jgi:hypothetical protein